MNTFEFEKRVINTKDLDVFIERMGLNTPVIIYGAGNFGQLCARHLLRLGIQIKCFIDLDSRLRDDKPFFIDIVSPGTAKSNYKNEAIIISPSVGGEGIEELLILAGFPGDRVYRLQYDTLHHALVLPDIEQKAPSQLPYVSAAPANPPITVFSLIYNTPAHYLRRAIESVLNQSFTDFEYLIIDHASDDATTSDIIGEYAALDARITVFRTEKNFNVEKQKGEDNLHLRKALVQGIKRHVNTEYFCVLDSDDYFSNEFIQYAYTAAVEKCADAVCFQSMVYHENNHEGVLFEMYPIVSKKIVTNNEKDKWLAYCETGMPRAWWTMLVKTDIFLSAFNCAWTNQNYVVSDNILSFEVLKACKKMLFTNNTYHFYTQRGTSISGGINSLDYNYAIKLFDWMFNEWISTTKHRYERLSLNSNQYTYTLVQFVLDMVSLYSTRMSGQYATMELCEYYHNLKKLLADEYVQRVICSRKYYHDWYKNTFGL